MRVASGEHRQWPVRPCPQYKRTGRWEAHIWDSSGCHDQQHERDGGKGGKGNGKASKGGGAGGSSRGGGGGFAGGGGHKGRQLHLGSFLTATQAARWAQELVEGRVLQMLAQPHT